MHFIFQFVLQMAVNVFGIPKEDILKEDKLKENLEKMKHAHLFLLYQAYIQKGTPDVNEANIQVSVQINTYSYSAIN